MHRYKERTRKVTAIVVKMDCNWPFELAGL